MYGYSIYSGFLTLSSITILIRLITLCIVCCILPSTAQYQDPYQVDMLPLVKLKLPAGFSIEQVALVTGHNDGKMLRRYTHLKPEALHSIRSMRIA